MKKLLFYILLELSKILSKLSIYFNLPFLTFLACAISLRKVKTKIKQKKNTNILVFEKSHGIEDIKKIIDYQLDEDINFYLLSRVHVRIIYDFFKKKNNQKDHEEYINKVFLYFKKYYTIKIVISFNIRYKSERILQKLDKKLNIKYLICQKECLFNNSEINEYINYLKKFDKFQGQHITVYNSIFKKMLLDSNYVNSEKVTVIGMPRADFYFNNKNTKKNLHILFLLIRPKTGLAFSKDNFTWNELAMQTVEEVLKFAEKNSHLDFIFKTKIINDLETLEQQKIIEKKNLKNCKIFSGGKSNNLILNAKLIITFNSTAILEGLILKKPVIVPYFLDKYKKKLEEFSINTNSSSVRRAFNKEELKNFLNEICSDKKYVVKGDSKNDELLINKYIGNIDGESSKKLFKVIQNLTYN